MKKKVTETDMDAIRTKFNSLCEEGEEKIRPKACIKIILNFN